MSWPMAFTVVGCVWALVVLLFVRTEQAKEDRADIRSLEKKYEVMARDTEWLKEAWRKYVSKEGPA